MPGDLCTATGIISLSPLLLADRHDWCDTWGNTRNLDRSWWLCHTSLKLCWPPQPWLHEQLAGWNLRVFCLYLYNFLCCDAEVFHSLVLQILKNSFVIIQLVKKIIWLQAFCLRQHRVLILLYTIIAASTSCIGLGSVIRDGKWL